MKKNKNAVIFSAFLFVASFIYLVVYLAALKNLSTPDNTVYDVVKHFAASPIFYFSMAYLVAAFTLAWANKPVSKNVKKACIIVCVALEAAYVALVTLKYFGVALPFFIWWFISLHPFIHLVPGALLSIGAFKDE